MPCLLDNECVTHEPQPNPGGLEEELKAVTSKSSMKRLVTMRLRGIPW